MNIDNFIYCNVFFSTALFNLKEFANALETLETGLKISEKFNEKKQNLFTDLIAKCQKEIQISAPKTEIVDKISEPKIQATPDVPAPTLPAPIK